MKIILEGGDGEIKKVATLLRGFKVTITTEEGKPFFSKVVAEPVKVQEPEVPSKKGKNSKQENE